jgi:hypothetical protein
MMTIRSACIDDFDAVIKIDAEPQSITSEIVNLTKVVLDTITLETALKGAMQRTLISDAKLSIRD